MTRRVWGLGTLLIAGALIVCFGVFAKPALAQYPYGFGRNPDYGNRPNPGGQLRWSGDVDDTAIVYIHGHDVRTETVSGKSTDNIHAHVFGYLSRFTGRVYLQNWEGRGRVRIIQQPSPDNDFTAAIRIRDPQPGRSHYELVVGWS